MIIRVLRLRKTSEVFGRLWNLSGIFGNDRVVFKNPSTPRIKISRLYLKKVGRYSMMVISCLLRTTCCVPQGTFSQKPYNKFVIDQASSVKMAGYLSYSFLCVYGPQLCLSLYPAILTLHLVNNQYVHTQMGFFMFFPFAICVYWNIVFFPNLKIITLHRNLKPQ